jgi:hypothetical protein
VVFIAAVCKRPAWVNTFAFLLLVATVMTHTVLLAPSTDSATGIHAGLWDGMYSSTTMPFGRFVAHLFPWVHYGRVFNSITEWTSYEDRKWKGRARDRFFGWSSLQERNNWTAIAVAHSFQYSDCGFWSPRYNTFNTVYDNGHCNPILRYKSDNSELDPLDTNEVFRATSGNLTYPGFRIKKAMFGKVYDEMDDVAPISASLGMLAMNIALYFVLAWYFGQVRWVRKPRRWV